MQAEALGATECYVLPAVIPSEPEAARGAMAVLARALKQIFDRAAATDLSAAQGQIHLLPAPRQTNANPFDFGHTTHLIHQGHATTRSALANPTRSPMPIG
jgi:hypothetical protein